MNNPRTPDETDVSSVLCRLTLQDMDCTHLPETSSAYWTAVEAAYCGAIDAQSIEIEKLKLANIKLQGELAAAVGRAVPAVCKPCESAAVQWQRTRFNRLLGFTAFIGSLALMLGIAVAVLWWWR